MGRNDMRNKVEKGQSIPITARQLEKFSDMRGGKLTSRDYEKLKHMELVDSPVRDAIWELKQFSVEMTATSTKRLRGCILYVGGALQSDRSGPNQKI